jgi:hypothetical protein
LLPRPKLPKFAKSYSPFQQKGWILGEQPRSIATIFCLEGFDAERISLKKTDYPTIWFHLRPTVQVGKVLKELDANAHLVPLALMKVTFMRRQVNTFFRSFPK